MTAAGSPSTEHSVSAGNGSYGTDKFVKESVHRRRSQRDERNKFFVSKGLEGSLSEKIFFQ